jgi:restriction endonuclease S subunit
MQDTNPTFQPFGKKIVSITGGATPLKSNEEQYAPEGIKLLRIQNISESGLVFDDLVYITKGVHNGLLARSQLAESDLLMTITGRIGTASVVQSFHLPANINQHIVRIRLKIDEILPEFASDYLNTGIGRLFSNRGVTGTTRIALDYEAIREIPICCPPLPVQQEMVSEMERARESRRRKLEQADALLAGLNEYLLKRIGLIMPEPDNRFAYATKLNGIKNSKQISANYFHPGRINALRCAQQANNIKRSARLEDIADFLRELTANYEPEVYLGLGGVQGNTGELADTYEEPGQGQAFIFHKDNVLFAHLRPYLNKVWLAEYQGVCSTEFHVIRVKDEVDDVLTGYLAAILRSSVIVSQTKHLMTGNTHPRLANDDVVDLVIPIPDIKIQQEVVSELHNRRAEARRLRQEAAREWKAAKARFEARLLGGEVSQ